MRILIFLLLLATSGLSLEAQLPATRVYMFEMSQITDSLFSFKKPKYLSSFNKSGYNNQPSFISDNELYLTVSSPETGEQAEIYSLNLTDYTKTRVTATLESEYSPVLMPDRFHFSCVRVEVDADQTQRLWRFPLDRSNEGQPVFFNIKDIGYHLWINDFQVALFIVGAPHYLSIADTRDGSNKLIISNIGRCFQKLPNGNFAFILKISDNFWQIRELNLATHNNSLIVNTLKGSEDFVIMRDGTILMGSGSKLYKFNKSIDANWLEIADFKHYNINNITRLAVSRDNKIVLVSE